MSTGLMAFLSDLSFGFMQLTTKADSKRAWADFKPICGVANEIKEISNPYFAAEKAIHWARKYKVNPHLGVVNADVQSSTYADREFKAMEYQVHVAVEKPPSVPLTCCTPQCLNSAILNSHTLQKQKVLQHVQNEQGIVYQTRNTPFSGETPLEKVSA